MEEDLFQFSFNRDILIDFKIRNRIYVKGSELSILF